jgi:hypothetical protein
MNGRRLYAFVPSFGFEVINQARGNFQNTVVPEKIYQPFGVAPAGTETSQFRKILGFKLFHHLPNPA